MSHARGGEKGKGGQRADSATEGSSDIVLRPKSTAKGWRRCGDVVSRARRGTKGKATLCRVPWQRAKGTVVSCHVPCTRAVHEWGCCVVCQERCKGGGDIVSRPGGVLGQGMSRQGKGVDADGRVVGGDALITSPTPSTDDPPCCSIQKGGRKRWRRRGLA